MVKYRLGDICEIVSGSTPKTGVSEYWDGDKKWITPAEITDESYIITDSVRKLTELGVAKTGLSSFPKGTVILSSRAPIGKVAIAGCEMYCNQGFKNLICSQKIYNRYLYWFLKGNTEYLNSLGRGATFKEISKQIVASIEINVPDMEQQMQAAENLERVSSIIRLRKQELQKLDDLIKARFVELFGNPISNPMKWDTYQLEECLERIDNGKSFICSDKPRVGDAPAILKLSAATYGDYRPNENKALLDESLFVESAEVHAGDLLFTRKNTPELVGTAAYVQNTPSKLMMPDLIFRLVPNEKVNAVFLWQLINCKEFRPVIQAISGGSAKSMSNISKERLGKIKVICPPRELQDSLIPFVEQTDKSKAAIQKALDEAQLLFDSLMQKYFG